MAKLTAARRGAIPGKDFAGPERSYPIEDASHARNALARASGKPVEARVRAAVHRKYPNIGEKSVKHGHMGRGKRPSESLHERGHHSNHGKHVEMSHADFHGMDHGGKHDHMVDRDGKGAISGGVHMQGDVK